MLTGLQRETVEHAVADVIMRTNGLPEHCPIQMTAAIETMHAEAVQAVADARADLEPEEETPAKVLERTHRDLARHARLQARQLAAECDALWRQLRDRQAVYAAWQRRADAHAEARGV
jgi:hypothetical protein